MRTIIAGSRYFNDFPYLNKECMYIFNELAEEGYNINRNQLEVVTGKMKGVEGIARLFSDMHKLNLKTIAPEDAVGPNGYFIRNDAFIEYALEDTNPVLIAFNDGSSIVTKDIVHKAYDNRIKTYVVQC